MTNRLARLLVTLLVVTVAGIGILAWNQVNGNDVLGSVLNAQQDDPAPADDTSEVGAATEEAPAVASVVPEGAQPATVEYVHDGDTLFLTDGRKVRLLGINTPEVGDNLECYGDEATAALRSLLPEGTDVWVLSDVEALDQYGRSLLFVYLPDGTNVNIAMVRSGAAEVVQYDPNWLLQGELRAAEDAAYSEGAGIWGNC
ncbi:endonuclease YncB(thermonuclease family) [Leifsonia sp. AK011]|uniref:thermonuclease family protein n=1 Tax=Leifsonia sp. AK011 TaxID=2723075 RepID=UPI00184D2465|nr:thermonuclease family protein [Leifsonia sp. AK011]NYF10077.1 endonuclease YncB(thermonuclease family) [Leifsonia sp. AK011]